jgi:hypothetical protein
MIKTLFNISLIFSIIMIGCGTEDTPFYNLSITVIPQEGGSVTKDPNQYVADKGTAFTLTAIPNDGYSFVGWAGDIISTENPIKFNIERAEVIIAEFALD